MAAHKKTEPMQQIIANMTPTLIGKLDGIAVDNELSRNEVVRRACQFLIDNPKKFKLKTK